MKMLESRGLVLAYFMQGVQAVCTTFLRFRRFILRDIPSVLYDFDTFDGPAYLSLPRVAFFVSGLILVVAYVREHFFGVPFERWGEIVAFFSACSAGYVGKKFAEKSK